MKSTLTLLCIGLISWSLGCQGEKMKIEDDQYAGHFGKHHFFETPHRITSRSGVDFEAYGWLIHEGTRNEERFLILRILCKWPESTAVEDQIYTQAKVLVDGREVLPASRLQHANIRPHSSDELEGKSPFILVQDHMPEKWDTVEIHFEGETPSTLKIRNI